MMTPEEFIKSKHNGEIPYKYGVRECSRLMNAFALHVLEIFERDIDAYDEANLKPFFEEIKKELK